MTDRSKKVSELPVHLNAPADNLLLIVADPSTANAETRKISLQNLFANVSTPTRINSTFRATGNTTFNGNINVDGDIIGNGDISVIAGQDSAAKLISSDESRSVFVNSTAAYVKSGNNNPFIFLGGNLTFPSNTSLNTITLNRAVIESNVNDGLSIATTEVGSGQYITLSYTDPGDDTKNTSLLLSNGQVQIGVGSKTWILNNAGNSTFPGGVTANTFIGGGQSISFINANNISTGTLSSDRLPSTVNVASLVNVGANVSVSTSEIKIGNSTANVTISGDGFVGVGEYITYINATNITDGTLDTALMPATLNVATAFNISDAVSLNTSSLSISTDSNTVAVNTSGIFFDGNKLKDTGDFDIVGTTILSGGNITLSSNSGASSWLIESSGDITMPEGATIKLYNGDSALRPIGPFTDDAEAALYGVLLGNMYYKADGTVHVRLV